MSAYVRWRDGARSMWGGVPPVQIPPDLGLQPPIPNEERGSMHVIDQTYESLDYDTCPNQLRLKESLTTTRSQTYYNLFLATWVAAFTGILTGFVAVLIDVVINYGSIGKFSLLQTYMSKEYSPAVFVLLWVTLNAAFVLPAIILGSIVEPVSAGSGIPQVKCYLNGVKIPRVVRFKTLVCKVFGVMSSVLGGLLVGKEGPMIHSGAVVAAGISQGKSTTFGKDFNFFHRFREDHEKRDFVACGSAAGVSAAFGAPVGGVLFALEEGASHWHQKLTWNSFVAAAMASASVNICLSLIYNRARGGLLDFGAFDILSTSVYDIVPLAVISVSCGLIGTLFNKLNKEVTILRMRYLNKWWQKGLEVLTVTTLTALLACAAMIFYPDCKPPPVINGTLYTTTGAQYSHWPFYLQFTNGSRCPVGSYDCDGDGQHFMVKDPHHPVQLACPDGQQSMTARLFMGTPEQSLKSLFHDPFGTYGIPTLAMHFVMTFFMACYTYGLGVPSGLFIPSLLVGASFGRLIGVIGNQICDFKMDEATESKYAVLGASALLGGVVRMTLSLVSIIMEAIGQATFAIPIFFCIYVSKWIGDRFNRGLYDTHIRLNGVPFLEYATEPLMENVFANQVMSSPAICVRPVESVRRLLLIARQYTHNGFPVVWDDGLSLGSVCSDDSGAVCDDEAEENYYTGIDFSDMAATGATSTANNTEDGREDSGSDQKRLSDIDRMLMVDPLVLKAVYARQNQGSGINSEEVRSQLLNDSCINRFSRTPDDSADTLIDVTNAGETHWFSCGTESVSLETDTTQLTNTKGLLCGIMLRSQIMVMLKHKMFIERAEYWDNGAWQDLRLFRDAYPRFYDLEAVDLLPEDLDCHVDFRPYMNPAPNQVSSRMNLPRVFSTFRSLGLRHLVVVDSHCRVEGVITRKDLVKFHARDVDGVRVLSRMNVYERV